MLVTTIEQLPLKIKTEALSGQSSNSIIDLGLSSPSEDQTIRPGSSSTLPNNATFIVGSTRPVPFQTSSMEHVPISHDDTGPLRTNIQLLETRVDSIEERLPLVEQATIFLHTMLSRTLELEKKTPALSKSKTTSSRSSNEPCSSTSESPPSSAGLSGKTESADFEEQVRMMLLTGKLRISLSDPTKQGQSGNSFPGKGKQRSNNSPISPLFRNPPLDDCTIGWPGGDDYTQLFLDTTMNNPPGEDDLNGVCSMWLQESSNLEPDSIIPESTLEEGTLQGLDAGCLQSLVCVVHGNACKSPEVCQLAAFCFAFEEQQGNGFTGADIIMGNDENTLPDVALPNPFDFA
jgi:hypothetical protein